MSHSDDLLRPPHLWSRQEILSCPSPIPKTAGVYAWYFQNLEHVIPCSTCICCGPFKLLYIGISPSAPPSNGKPPSKQSLYDRVRYHFQGNAEGSTLRLSLGCLLAGELDIELRRVGSGRRLTFSSGETRLSAWMEENARVVWRMCDEPWGLEQELIVKLDLPLNLDQNGHHRFSPVLRQLRQEAKARARELSILPK